MDRAIELMKLAAKYIQDYHNYGVIEYDDALCDGECLAQDLLAEVDQLTKEALK